MYDSLISVFYTIHLIPSALSLQSGNTLFSQFFPQSISVQILPPFDDLRSMDFYSVPGCHFLRIVHLEILNHQPFDQQRIHSS
jgi:hypothetical protein